MAYRSLLPPQAVLPARHVLAWARGSHGLCALLALAVALVQASAFASRTVGAGQSANQRLGQYVPWIESTIRLPGSGASVAEFARYYAWSMSNPGDVRMALVRDPSQTGVHITDIDKLPRPTETACDSITARVDVVKRRILEVACDGPQ